MKKQLRILLAVVALATATFTSCKKTDNNNNSDYTNEFSAQSDDQAQVSGETDAIADDANTIIDSHPSISGKPFGISSLICDATIVVDSVSNPKTITITYNGNNCFGNRSRTGVVVLSMPQAQHWSDAGAILTVTYQNLRITRLRDGKSITINGAESFTNVSGGRIRDLAISGPVTHSIASSGLSISFDNGTQRTWQIAKQRVFSYDNGIVITTTGTHTEGTITNVSEWGTNRFGNAFVTSITTPLVVRQDCSFRLVSGAVTHHRLIADIVVTFGLDAQGLPISCPPGSFYFKVVWTGLNGVVRTVILPY